MENIPGSTFSYIADFGTVPANSGVEKLIQLDNQDFIFESPGCSAQLAGALSTVWPINTPLPREVATSTGAAASQLPTIGFLRFYLTSNINDAKFSDAPENALLCTGTGDKPPLDWRPTRFPAGALIRVTAYNDSAVDLKVQYRMRGTRTSAARAR